MWPVSINAGFNPNQRVKHAGKGQRARTGALSCTWRVPSTLFSSRTAGSLHMAQQETTHTRNEGTDAPWPDTQQHHWSLVNGLPGRTTSTRERIACAGEITQTQWESRQNAGLLHQGIDTCKGSFSPRTYLMAALDAGPPDSSNTSSVSNTASHTLDSCTPPAPRTPPR